MKNTCIRMSISLGLLILLSSFAYRLEAHDPLAFNPLALLLSVFVFSLFREKRESRLLPPCPADPLSLETKKDELSAIRISLGIGTWQWNVRDQSLFWDEGMFRLYGLEPRNFHGHCEDWQQLLHPEDREQLARSFSEAVREKRSFRTRFRIFKFKTGEIRAIETQSQVILSERNEVIRVIGINWDVTEQMAADKAIALQKELNEAILENIPIGVFVKDIQDKFNILMWNKASEDLFEVEKSRILGKNAHDLWPKEHADMYLADDQAVVRSGVLLDIPEEPVVTSKRGTIILHTKKLPLRLKQEIEPRFLLGICEDITAKKIAQAEQKLQAHRLRTLHQRYKLAVLGAGFGVWEFDLSSHRLIWDEQMYQIYGHTPDSFDGSADMWRQCIHPLDRALVDRRFDDLLQGKVVELFEFRAIRASDGQMRYVEANGFLQLDSEGKPQQLVGMNRDITERKKLDETFRQTQQLFRTTFENAPLGIAVIDSMSGRIYEVNSSFATIAGRSIAALKEIDWMQITHPDDIQADLDLMAQLNAGEIKSFKLAKRYIKPDGTIVWIDMAIAPLPLDDHAQRVHLCMIEDITEQRKTEAELRRAKDMAEESTQVKSAFLANMSHEIRTPLAVIRGFTELLLTQSKQSDIASHWVANILRSSQQLEALLADILDLSKVEMGKVTLEFATVSILQIIKEIRSLHELAAQDKGVRLSFSIAGGIPELIRTDATRFNQVLSNVIGNAIKFTEAGQVEVILSRRSPAREGVGPQLSITVKDTGVGIRPQEQEKIFEAFTQADTSITRRYGGTGLGLALARHLARLLGGDVVLLGSQTNKGTSFEITIDPGILENTRVLNRLPTLDTASPLSLVEDQERISLSELKVLLVEDAPDLQALFKLILTAHGARVKTAGNGQEALDICHQEAFDIILMDIQMPVLGGHEATRRLRSEGYAMPIIALTAHAMKGERERCLAEGFTEHLSKPVDIKKMLQLLDSCRIHSLPPFSPPSSPPVQDEQAVHDAGRNPIKYF